MGPMRSKRRAVVALLTDFGTRDPYVAAMKGVISSRCEAAILDLSHEIEPFDIFGAGYFLSCVERFYESDEARRVVFVAVVDPGVGSARRIIAARSGGRFFLAPDNGLLSIVVEESASIVSVENDSLFLPSGSRTFHGRDRFAPVAAVLADGADLADLGPRAEFSSLVRLDYERPEYRPSECAGTIVAIDRFGNVITDIDATLVKQLSGSELCLGQTRVSRFFETYESGRGTDGPFMIIGSNGTVEVSVAGGSAATVLGVTRLDRVALRFP